MRTSVAAALAVWVCTAGVHSSDRVAVEAIGPVTLTPGGTDTVGIELDIAPRFHIQANPAAGEFLIPLDVTLEVPESVMTWQAQYPAPDTLRLAGSDDDLLVYHGSVVVALTVRAAPGAAPGTRDYPVVLRYQACDSTRCYFPESLSTTVRVTLARKNEGS